MSIYYSGRAAFEATTVGALPPGWVALVGTHWAIENTVVIAGTRSLGDQGGADSDIIVYNGTAAPTADMEITYDVVDDQSIFMPIIRADSNAQNCYAITTGSSSAGHLDTINIYKRVSGTFTQLTTVNTGDTTNYPTSTLSFRVNITGNRIRMRWWIKGNTEPSTWQVDYTDSANSITTGGYFGFYYQRPGSPNSATLDNVQANDLQAATATDFTVTPSNQNTTAGVSTGDYTVQTSPAGSVPSSSVTVSLSDGGAGGTFTNSSGTTITSVSLTDANPKTFRYVPSGAASGTINITCAGSGGLSTSHGVTATIPAVAADFSIMPSSRTTTPGVASAAYTVTLNGTLSSNAVITLNDGGAGGTFSPSSLTFTSGNALTPQTFTYTPAIGTGGTTKTLSASASGAFTSGPHTVSCVVSSGPVTVGINDGNLFFSPYNWYKSGSAFALSQVPGAYLKLGFTGTSITGNFDISAYASLFSNGSQWPVIAWSIDDGPFTVHQMDSGSAALALASGLTSGTHQLYLVIQATDQNFDRWGISGNPPKNSIKLTSFTIDSGAASAAPVPVHTDYAVHFGDSITEGVQASGNTSGGDTQKDDSRLAYSTILGKSLFCEFGCIGYGGLGWVVPSSGSSPPGAQPFDTPGNASLTSWDKYFTATSRLVGGLLSPAPKFVTVMLGTNDRSQPGSSVTASVTDWLPKIRAAAGPNAWIFVIYEFTQNNQQSAVLAGFNAYQAATPDSKCVIIDLGTEVQNYFNANTVETQITRDGLHPYYMGTGWIAGMLVNKMLTAMGGGGGGAIIAPHAIGFSGGFQQ